MISVICFFNNNQAFLGLKGRLICLLLRMKPDLKCLELTHDLFWLLTLLEFISASTIAL